MGAEIRKQGHARTLGESRVPVSDGHHFHAAVGLESLDHGAEGIEVRHHCPIRAGLPALEVRAYGAAPCEFEVHAQLLQLVAHEVHDPVGEPAGAGNAEQFEKRVEDVGLIYGQLFHCEFYWLTLQRSAETTGR